MLEKNVETNFGVLHINSVRFSSLNKIFHVLYGTGVVNDTIYSRKSLLVVAGPVHAIWIHGSSSHTRQRNNGNLLSLLSSGTAWLLVGLIVSLIICADHFAEHDFFCKQTHYFDLDDGIGLFETSVTLFVVVVLFCCCLFWTIFFWGTFQGCCHGNEWEHNLEWKVSYVHWP